jgi:hypothetical protein
MGGRNDEAATILGKTTLEATPPVWAEATFSHGTVFCAAPQRSENRGHMSSSYRFKNMAGMRGRLWVAHIGGDSFVSTAKCDESKKQPATKQPKHACP